jgi:hypothetical protein
MKLPEKPLDAKKKGMGIDSRVRLTLTKKGSIDTRVWGIDSRVRLTLYGCKEKRCLGFD